MSELSSDEPTDEELASFLGDFTENGKSEGSQFSPLGSFDVDAEDAPTEDSFLDQDEEPIKIGDGECAVCGAPTFRPPGLTRTGRAKRAPKYCDLHNPKLNKERKLGPDFAPQDLEGQLRKIQGELSDDLMLLGTLTGPLFPVTGMYIIDNSDAFTTALLKLCKNNPRLMRNLHRAAQVAPIYQLFRFGAGVGVAVQTDQKKVDPYGPMAQRLGVSRAYDMVYPDLNSSSSSSSSSGPNSNFSGPPKYATVR